MEKKGKIVCVHMLNDFSGSPNMLKQAVLVLLKDGFEIDVILNKETKGFLSDIEGVSYHFVNYHFSKNKLLTLFRLLLFQFQVFKCLFLNFRNKNITLFINSSYPFSAAVFGKIFKKKVVYYLHETKINPPMLKAFLLKVVKKCSSKVIFVSKYLAAEIKSEFETINGEVIYNALDDKFMKITTSPKVINGFFNVIFIASLKDFKGVHTFVEIAKEMSSFSNISFTMKLNGEERTLEGFKNENKSVKNLQIIDSSSNILNLYNKGHLLLNLSKPSMCVETFGLTILEGFSFGVPAIVPNVGGPLEVVDNGINGYTIDVEDKSVIKTHILKLYCNKEKYLSFSQKAKEKSAFFNIEKYQNRISLLFSNNP